MEPDPDPGQDLGLPCHAVGRGKGVPAMSALDKSHHLSPLRSTCLRGERSKRLAIPSTLIGFFWLHEGLLLWEPYFLSSGLLGARALLVLLCPLRPHLPGDSGRISNMSL